MALNPAPLTRATTTSHEANTTERALRPNPISRPLSDPQAPSVVRPADVQAFQKIGAPYQVNGTWYIPTHEPDYNETGTASWYGSDFHGRSTANGELFDMNVVSAAHPTLPIPSLVEVTNLSNGRSMVVRVNDRGPFVADRLIDLSARGAELLGYREQGSAQVRVRYVGPADPEPLVSVSSLSPPREEKKWAKPTPTPSSTLVATVTRVVEQKPGRANQTVPSKPSSGQGNLFVQAGAFSRRANADRVLSQVSTLGPAQVVETQTTSGATLYRVLIGPVRDHAEAKQLAETVGTFGVSGAHVMASLD